MINSKWFSFEIIESTIGKCYIHQAENSRGYHGYAFFKALDVFLDEVVKQKIYCLIFTAQLGNSFSKGFNYKQLEEIVKSESPEQMLQFIISVLKKLENLPFPTISAISGSCYGSGLEFALHTTYRFAEDSPKTIFKFPELNIGLFPILGSAGWFYTRMHNLYYPSLLALRDSTNVRMAYVMGVIDDYFTSTQFNSIVIKTAQQIIFSGHFSSSRPKRQGVTLASSLLRQQKTINLGSYNALWTMLRKNQINEYFRDHVNLTVKKLQDSQVQADLIDSDKIIKYMSEIKCCRQSILSVLSIGFMGLNELVIPLVVKLLQAGHYVFVYEKNPEIRLSIKVSISNYFQHEVRGRKAFYRLSVSSLPSCLSRLNACFCLKSQVQNCSRTAYSHVLNWAIYEDIDTIDESLVESTCVDAISVQIVPKWLLFPFAFLRYSKNSQVNKKFWQELFLSLDIIPLDAESDLSSSLFSKDRLIKNDESIFSHNNK